MRLVVNYLLFLLLGLAAAAQEPGRPQEAAPSQPEVIDATTSEPPLADEEQKSIRRGSSRYGRDITVLGDNVVIAEGEVAKDVTVIGGSVMIDGKVTGDLVVIGGLVALGPTAEVLRDVTIIGGGWEKAVGAKVDGEPVIINWDAKIPPIPGFEGVQAWVTHGLLMGRPLPPQVSWSWWAGGIFLLLYLVIALLFPGPMQASMGVLDARPGTSFLTGLLAFVLALPLLILLAVTVVGLILVPFLVCGGLAAYLFGKAAVYGYAGRRIGGGVQFLRTPVVAVIIGAVLFYLMYMVPVLGFLVWGIVAPLGVGAVLLAFFGKLRSEKPTPVPIVPPVDTGSVAPVNPAPPLGSTPVSPSSSLPITLPRAGFWLRFLATVIDAAIILTICKLVEARPGWFLVLWTAYHIAMWAWRGATIGGMVLGLRIVQTNGQPLTLGVAIVRSLASFLSAVVLLLGFFWAGWSRQKQSWHDIIAGTCVVKGARNKPLEVSPAV